MSVFENFSSEGVHTLKFSSKQYPTSAKTTQSQAAAAINVSNQIRKSNFTEKGENAVQEYARKKKESLEKAKIMRDERQKTETPVEKPEKPQKPSSSASAQHSQPQQTQQPPPRPSSTFDDMPIPTLNKRKGSMPPSIGSTVSENPPAQNNAFDDMPPMKNRFGKPQSSQNSNGLPPEPLSTTNATAKYESAIKGFFSNVTNEGAHKKSYSSSNLNAFQPQPQQQSIKEKEVTSSTSSSNNSPIQPPTHYVQNYSKDNWRSLFLKSCTLVTGSYEPEEQDQFSNESVVHTDFVFYERRRGAKRSSSLSKQQSRPASSASTATTNSIMTSKSSKEEPQPMDLDEESNYIQVKPTSYKPMKQTKIQEDDEMMEDENEDEIEMEEKPAQRITNNKVLSSKPTKKPVVSQKPVNNQKMKQTPSEDAIIGKKDYDFNAMIEKQMMEDGPSPQGGDAGGGGDDDEEFREVEREECPVCGKKFAVDRLAKHVKICEKRKNMDKKIVVHKTNYEMVDGKGEKVVTERAVSVSKKELTKRAEADKKKKKDPNYMPKWKREHLQFEAILKAGKPSDNENENGGEQPEAPSYDTRQQCPHCLRKFNEIAYDRHIGVCAKKQKDLGFQTGTNNTNTTRPVAGSTSKGGSTASTMPLKPNKNPRGSVATKSKYPY